MVLPRPQRQIVLLPRGLQRLIARLVSEVIGKLRALGARDQMQNRVVAREHLLLGFAEVRQNLPELLVRDIRLVVKQRPVVDDQHVFLRHHLRALQRQLFLMQLVCDHKILKIQHRHAVAERADAEAGNQLRRRLRNRNHLPAVVLLELLENAADERRFACGGSAGQNNSCDVLCHAAGSSPSIATHIVPSGAEKARAAWKNRPRRPVFREITAQTGCYRALHRSRSAPEAAHAAPAQ